MFDIINDVFSHSTNEYILQVNCICVRYVDWNQYAASSFNVCASDSILMLIEVTHTNTVHFRECIHLLYRMKQNIIYYVKHSFTFIPR